MRSAVIQFPGSNCERDALTVLQREGLNPSLLWHQDVALPSGLDLIVIPGGFSFGDYLRCGAMAAQSPIMREVKRFASGGGLLLGICNGFQILCETGLLPGTLIRNTHLKFRCRQVSLRVDSVTTPFTIQYTKGQVIRIPIAHNEGCYYADDATLQQMRDRGQIVFRYCDEEGECTTDANPNGALDHIAGISNERGNVVGMMPHPERASEALLGGEDGRKLFASILQHVN